MNKSETGNFFVWMGMTIFLTLTVLGYLYFNNTRLAAYTHLQAIAEAAAISGAQQLCPADGCLDNAFASAITTINHNFSLQHTGYKKISLEPLPAVDPGLAPYRQSYLSVDRSTTLEVIIYPGWITPDAHDSTKQNFTHLDSAWLLDNPGIPPQFVMNSLVVEIKLKGLTSIVGFSVGNSGDTIIKAKALARSGPVSPVPTVPFAIPVCSLVNESGSFNQEEICYGDRLFTQSDRYLPDVHDFLPFGVSYQEAMEGIGPFKKPDGGIADEYLNHYNYLDQADAETKRLEAFKQNKFGVRPSFFYGPCSKDINECNIKRQINYSLDSNNTSADNEYSTFGGWTNYAYNHISDHFGVVGHTKSNLAQNESALLGELITIKNKGASNELAFIGQPFAILHQGLKFSASGNAIWELIKAQGEKSYFFGDLSLLNNEVTLSSNRTAGLAHLPNFPNLELLPDQPLTIPTLPTTIIPAGNPETNSFRRTVDLFFNDARLESNQSPTFNPTSYPTMLRDQFSNGLCRSRRMMLKCEGDVDLLTADKASVATKCSSNLSQQHTHFESTSYNYTKQSEFSDYTGTSVSARVAPKEPDLNDKVWKTKIPIIAETGKYAASCLGANLSKPRINPRGDYQIIGFVDIDIFDLDIGDAPLTTPVEQTAIRTTAPEVLTTNPNPDDPNFHDYHLKHYLVRTDLKVPVTPDDSSNPNAGPNPWQFQIDDPLSATPSNTPKSCNLVRARVACNNNFISSSQNYGPRRAEIINSSIIP